MIKKFFIKKIVSVITATVTLVGAFAAMTIVSAEETFKTTYTASVDFSGEQGKNQWYYKLYKEGEYEDITTFTGEGAGAKWDGLSSNGGPYITPGNIHPGNKGITTNRIWQAPMSGTVKLTSNGNVAKSGIGGPGVTAAIYVNGTDNQIYSQYIEGTDKVGYNYNLVIDVKAGDRIYFEISATGTAYGATVWDPVVTYTQAAQYKTGGNVITTAKDLTSGGLSCTLYDSTINSGTNGYAYLAVYDENESLRAVSGPSDIKFGSNSGFATLSLSSVPQSDDYSNWRAELIVITTETCSEGERFFPIELSDSIALK